MCEEDIEDRQRPAPWFFDKMLLAGYSFELLFFKVAVLRCLWRYIQTIGMKEKRFAYH